MERDILWGRDKERDGDTQKEKKREIEIIRVERYKNYIILDSLYGGPVPITRKHMSGIPLKHRQLQGCLYSREKNRERE